MMQSLMEDHLLLLVAIELFDNDGEGPHNAYMQQAQLHTSAAPIITGI
jgi:hypothetical protein